MVLAGLGTGQVSIVWRAWDNMKNIVALTTSHSQPRNCHVNWLPQSSSNDIPMAEGQRVSFDELWGNQFTWQFRGCEWLVGNAIVTLSRFTLILVTVLAETTHILQTTTPKLHTFEFFCVLFFFATWFGRSNNLSHIVSLYACFYPFYRTWCETIDAL